MKFNFKKQKYFEDNNLDIDIAPMVDVIFLLLIFFMVTSTFILQPGFKIDLPNANVSDNKTADYLIVYVNKTGEIFLNEKKTNLDNLGIKIKKAFPKLKDLTIALNADKTTEYGKIIQITDIAKLSGIKNVILTTEPYVK